jgi:Tol biopolymer transport system component
VFAALLVVAVAAGHLGAAAAARPVTTPDQLAGGPARAVGPTPSPVGGGTGRIAFNADGKGGWDIFLMNADGANVTNLTRSCQDEQGVSWSADGTRIAYSATRPVDACGPASGRDTHDVYAMNADGTGATRLTADPAEDGAPSWSPDGRRVAFYSNRADPTSDRYDVYVMDADGANVTRVTTAGGAFPAWSPDGRQIAFHNGGDIYVVDPDGTGAFDATAGSAGNDEWQSWAPDGAHLAVYSTRADPGTDHYDVWVVDLAGAAARRLTRGAADQDVPCPPAWSPDGTLIAYTTRHGEAFEIRRVGADGSGDVPLTPGRWAGCPAWEPRPLRGGPATVGGSGPIGLARVHARRAGATGLAPRGLPALSDALRRGAGTSASHRVQLRRGVRLARPRGRRSGPWRLPASGGAVRREPDRRARPGR